MWGEMDGQHNTWSGLSWFFNLPANCNAKTGFTKHTQILYNCFVTSEDE
jgi:hypothetical protein